MKMVFVNQRVALVAILGSLLPLLGVALGESSATALQPSNVLMNEQVYRSFRPRERILTTYTTVWCIARSNVSDVDLQNALDWVCGPLPGQGQVNCGPINAGGACFDPADEFHHTSFAFNELFQLSNGFLASCNFTGCGVITNVDPSSGTCEFQGSIVVVDSNLTNIIGALPPVESPWLGPPQTAGSVILGFQPRYLFCVSTVVTLATYLFT